MHEEFNKRVNSIVEKYGDKTAITFMRENDKQDKLSFYQVKQFIESVEILLNKAGIKRGDRVAIMMEHSPYPVLIGLSLAYLNVTSVLIDASLPKQEKEKLLLLADVRAFFTSKAQLEEISEDIVKVIPGFFVDEWNIMKLNNSVDKCVEKTTDSELDVIAILFSSGTTDQMKGIKTTYSSVLKAREVFVRFSGLKDYMNYLLVLPFNHIAGFTGAMTYFLTGCELGFIENVNSNKLQEGLINFQPYYFAMVPKVYEVIEQKIRAKIHEKGKVIEFYINILLGLSGLIRKYLGINIGRKVFAGITQQVFGKNIYGIGTGASPCKESTTKFFLNLGLEWSNLYATTETNVPIVATGIQDRYSVGTIGKVDRHPEIEVKIINGDKDNVGEIAVKSELIMKGYFRQPELTAMAFENGYFKTGDYGFIDKKGYLHITGRIKESIVLRTGKKVSPSDVDEYYLERVKNINLASRGIVNEKEKYDEIHMFVENKEYSEREKKRIIDALKDNSKKAPGMYKIDKIHFVNKIPITSVGKVKRFCLDISKAEEIKKSEGEEKTRVSFSNTDNIDVIVSQIIKNILNMTDDVKFSQDAKIKADIGLDSLNCFEMCVAIEENFGVSIENKLSENITIKDIVNYIKQGRDEFVDKASDASKYPLVKTTKDKKRFELFTKISRRLWKVEAIGLENIDFNENYIFCPNHESHFDGMWILGCLPDKVKSNFCSMAADYLFESKQYRFGIKIMGGIPVHRNANTTIAMKRVYECISKEEKNLLIHPEGTRTRNGELGDFKFGAAELSLGTGVKIIPIYINGAREIFPPDRRLPRILHKGKKLKLQIVFGKPISPEDKSASDITKKIRQQIIDMKNSGGGA